MKESDFHKATSGRKDLRGLDLEGANLSTFDLSGAVLEFSNLCNADLRGANLSNVSFLGAQLWRADLTNANAKEANFTGANLRLAKFEGCALEDATLHGAFMSPSDYRSALFPEYQCSNGMLLLKPELPPERPKKAGGTQLVVYSPDSLVESIDSLIAVAESLVKLAMKELDELSNYNPNSPEMIAEKKRQMDILEEFRDGFKRIAKALRQMKLDPTKQEETQNTINVVATKLEKRWTVVENWWGEDSARGFMTRSSLSVAAISFFGWTGAPLALVTPVVLGSVFGKQILSTVKD